MWTPSIDHVKTRHGDQGFQEAVITGLEESVNKVDSSMRSSRNMIEERSSDVKRMWLFIYL